MSLELPADSSFKAVAVVPGATVQRQDGCLPELLAAGNLVPELDSVQNSLVLSARKRILTDRLQRHPQ
jgi:hypothetical protein